jgi:OOP family OmpA-OmpF porin
MEPFFIWTAIILALPFITIEPKSTIILLDNNTSHNAIDVSTSSGTVSIDQPYYFTTLVTPESLPSPIEKADPEMIREKYASLLNILPDKAVSMLFYFDAGTANITQSSQEQIEKLVAIIASMEPASIDIIGHSDRDGDADKNYELALERAQSVEKFLLSKNVKLEHSSVISYGENDPIVPTEDGVAEPKNRRVEVIVR